MYGQQQLRPIDKREREIVSMTNEEQHRSPTGFIRGTRVRPSMTALAVGAALLTAVTAWAQPQIGPQRPAYRSTAGRWADAAAAKAAAGAAFTGTAAAMPAPSVAGTFTEFDVPGAGTGSQQGTLPFAINPAGTVTGYYSDANSLIHGFVRTAGGAVVSFDAPGQVYGTYPSAINAEGTVTGYYYDANYDSHGFVRTSDGILAEFDAPRDFDGIYPAGIDDTGVVAGTYYNANYVIRAFLRFRNGTIAVFDDPSAGTGASEGTTVGGMNALGAIAGCYTDPSFDYYAFLRASDGTFTTLAPPTSTGDSPSCFPYNLTAPQMAINALGAIAGNYYEPETPFGLYRGFLRSPDGAYATFDAATYSPCCIFTYPLSLNWAGTIAGYFNDGYNLNHGFLRDSGGAITILDAPNAGQGNYQGTIANGINPWGTVAGLYIDANSACHGFLWRP